MFSSIGEKIKGLARILTIIGCVISFIYGIGLSIYDFHYYVTSFLIIVLGCFGSWLSYCLLYAFGELVSQTTKIAELLEKNGSVDKNNLNTPKEDE